MMNRMALESFANSGRRASVGSHIRNGGGGKFNTGGDGDDGLDLFSKTTRRSDGDQIRLDKITAGPGRIGRGMEDLLDCEIGKHDYDWLLTPPETPLYPSAVARENSLSSNSLSRESSLSSTAPPAISRESPLSSTGPRSRATARSVSSTRPSRLSTSQTDSSHPTRPVRSSSVTRPSISSSYSTSFSNNNKTSMLNTSSSSITSSRPSTPNSRLNKPSSNSTTTRPSSSSTSIRPTSSSAISRPSSSSTISRTSSNSSNARSSSNTRPVNPRLPTPTKTRPSTSTNSSTRPVNSRLPTPSKTRPNLNTTSSTRNSTNSRPSTPNSSSRPQTPSNSNLNSNSNVASRINSRPSTPTRRPSSSGGPSASTAASRIPATNRAPPVSIRNPSGSGSRPSSPGPRARAPVRPIDLPDFPTDAPPNLRTKLPDRPASAGRTRPGMALTLRSNTNNDAIGPPIVASASNRRNYAPPVVSKGRFPENPPKGNASKLHGSGNGHDVVPDNGLRRPVKIAASESTGFGRNISKKSLDMALRHMDIRQGMGGLRASSLFPQSIRSTTSKTRPVRKSDPVVPLSHDEYMHESRSNNGTTSPDCRSSIAFSDNGDFAPGSVKSPDRESLSTTRDSEFDLLHGSSRYDAFMLKEDSTNMNWLHSVEDKNDQSPVFDHRFEPLPEPFDLS